MYWLVGLEVEVELAMAAADYHTAVSSRVLVGLLDRSGTSGLGEMEERVVEQLGIRAWHQRERSAEREGADDVAMRAGEGYFE